MLLPSHVLFWYVDCAFPLFIYLKSIISIQLRMGDEQTPLLSISISPY